MKTIDLDQYVKEQNLLVALEMGLIDWFQYLEFWRS